MKLGDYLKTAGQSPDDFAAALEQAFGEAVSGSGVKKWASGERVPREPWMGRIYAATGGQVAPNDFYDIPETAVSEHEEDSPVATSEPLSRLSGSEVAS